MRFFQRYENDTSFDLPHHTNDKNDTSTMLALPPPASKSSSSRHHRHHNKCVVTRTYAAFWKGCGRRWCCTSGGYPLFVAMLATAGFGGSWYSSSGCQFIDITIGFTPNNVAWNQSRAELGLFYYHHRSSNENDVTPATSNDWLYDGCVWYTDTFQEKVIERDRTWRVSRIMAMIAVSSSLLVMLTLWMIVVTPIPTSCLWPGLLLPNTMLSFIAEGSKFLLFDIALCQKDVWFPSGVDSLPETAQQCQLGSSAYYGIAAGVLHLLSLICISLRTPTKRTIDPSYGIYHSSSGTADRSDVFRGGFADDDNDNERPNRTNRSLHQDPSLLDEDIYTEGPSPAHQSLVLKTIDHDFSTNHDPHGPPHEGNTSPDDDSSGPLGSQEPSSSGSRNRSISESRMAVRSQFVASGRGGGVMEPTQQRMIEDLLSELDTSLADERYDD